MRIRVQCLEKFKGEDLSETKIFDVTEDMLVDDLLHKTCKRFCKWDSWKYAFLADGGRWLRPGSSMSESGVKEGVRAYLICTFDR